MKHYDSRYDQCECGKPKRVIAARCQPCAGLARRESAVTRFVRFVRPVDGPRSCWQWTGGRYATGYGAFNTDKSVKAHRFAYELFVGPIPDGLSIDHLCRNTLCVNPTHLEPVPIAENIRRAFEARGFRCGHPRTTENSYFRPDAPTSRMCRICIRTRSQVSIAKRRETRRARAVAA